MDALTYFLLNYGLYSLLLVVPAALLGVAYGWFRRGKYQAGVKEVRKRMEDAEGIAQEVEIALSKEREQFKLYRDSAEEGGTAPVAPPELDREMAALRRDNEELEKLLRAARAEREEAEGNLAALLEEKTRLSEGVAAREREKSGLEKELSAKAKAKSEEKVVVKGATAGVPKAELKKFKAEKRELEKKLAALAREYQKKFAVQEKSANRKTGELEKRVAGLDAEFKSKSTEASELRDAKGKLEAELAEQRQEEKMVGKELGQVQAAHARVEKKLGGIEKERDEKLSELAALQKECAELTRKLDAEVKSRKEEREKIGVELSVVKEERDGIEGRMEGIQKERDDKLEELERLEKEREELADKLAREVKRRSDEQKKTADELDLLRTKRDELETQVGALAKEKEQGVQDLKKLAGERGDLDSKLVEAQAGATVAEAKLSEVVGDKKSLEDDLASIRGERDELKQSLEETSAEKGGLEVRVTELDERVTRTSDELDQLSIAKVELEGRVAEAQGEVAMVRMDMDLAQQEREAGREELEKRKVAEGKWADELHRLREEKKELNEHMAILAGDSKAKVLINQLKAEKERLMHDFEDQKRERQQVEDAAGVLRREMHGLRNELVDAEKRIGALGEIQENLVAAEERLSRTQADLKRTLDERKGFADKVDELETVNAVSQETQRILADEIAELETAQKEAQAGRKAARTAERLARVAKARTKPEPDPEPELTRKRSSAAADDLRASLATEDKPRRKSAPEVRAEQLPGSGEDSPAEKGLEDLEDLDDLGELEDLERAAPPPVRLQAAKKLPVEGDLYEDKRRGMLYRSAPAKIDDLTQLKGVGEVIRDRLQEAGIYTFRQVAAWRAPQVRVISEELKLRDRVKRDGWQKQARVFYKEKYGEAP